MGLKEGRSFLMEFVFKLPPIDVRVEYRMTVIEHAAVLSLRSLIRSASFCL
jgi:hypothetical protein